jgi:hypothetical protein
VTTYWYQGDERAKAFTLAGEKVAADTHFPGAHFTAEAIMDLQWPLNEIEVARTRWLARAVGEVLEKVFREVEPGMTEREIQRHLHSHLISQGMDYEVAIVGSDQRIHKHRHVLATDKPLERYLLLGPVVRKWGLFALVSRSAHFDEPPAKCNGLPGCRHDRGRIVSILEDGLKFSQILDYQKAWYEQLGVPEAGSTISGWANRLRAGRCSS